MILLVVYIAGGVERRAVVIIDNRVKLPGRGVIRLRRWIEEGCLLGLPVLGGLLTFGRRQLSIELTRGLDAALRNAGERIRIALAGGQERFDAAVGTGGGGLQRAHHAAIGGLHRGLRFRQPIG